MLPPIVVNLPGRPKKARRREPDENEEESTRTKVRRHGMKMTCKKCGNTWHNQRTCGVEKKQRQKREIVVTNDTVMKDETLMKEETIVKEEIHAVVSEETTFDEKTLMEENTAFDKKTVMEEENTAFENFAVDDTKKATQTRRKEKLSVRRKSLRLLTTPRPGPKKISHVDLTQEE